MSYGIKGLEINKPELEIKLVFKFDVQEGKNSKYGQWHSYGTDAVQVYKAQGRLISYEKFTSNTLLFL